jgi:hypothetical protein
MSALSEFKTELEELLTNAEALEQIRALDARAAAMFSPGPSDSEMGSQQIIGRYPQHEFASANALEQQRSRMRKKAGSDQPPGDRFIDLVLSVTRDVR